MRTSVVTRNHLQINSRVATRNSSGTDFKSHRSPEAFLGSPTLCLGVGHTAEKSLGLAIPESFLSCADEVIE